MPDNPRIYSSRNAPATPKQGDIQFNESNNRIEVYTGSAWGQVNFATTTVTDLTADTFTISAGFASTNSTGPAFYIPTVTGAATGAVASLGGRAPIVYNTTGRAIMVRQGGSWFTTVSLALA